MARPLTETSSSYSSSGLSAADPDLHRHRIAEQIKEVTAALDPWDPAEDGSAKDGAAEDSRDGHARRLREVGALATWAALSLLS